MNTTSENNESQYNTLPVTQSTVHSSVDMSTGVSMDSSFASSAASAVHSPSTAMHGEFTNGQPNPANTIPDTTGATAVIPPLTPIKDVRKRTFSSEDRDEEEPLASTGSRLTPTIAKDAKPLIHWHFISSAAGEANAAYSSFVPLRLRSSSSASDFSDELPDINETELWWGMAGARSVGEVKEESKNELIEQKQADDEVNQQDSKRIKLSEECPMSPAPASATNDSASSPLSSSPLHTASLLGSFGQDAYFSSSQFGCSIMAVADGVGGWRENGIDSGEVSRAMMAATRTIALDKFDADKSKKNFMLNPSELLISAYNKVKTSNEVEGGSTTVCIVALTPVPVTQLCTTVIPVHSAHQQQLDQPSAKQLPDSSAAMEVSASAIASYIAADASMLDVIGAVIDQSQNLVAHDNAAVPFPPQMESIAQQPLEPLSNAAAAAAAAIEAEAVQSGENVYLSACNLGDSGYMILRRDAEGVYRMITLSNFQRNIRAVKQVAIIPPQFQHDSYCDDSPAEAELDAHLLQENDIVILATDGLWDNLIATDWSETLFLPYFNSAATNERIAKQRKVSMCLAVEAIAAECARLFQAKKDSIRVQHVSESVAPSTHSTPSRPFRPSISFSPSTQHSSLFSSSSSGLDHHTLVSITRDDMPDSGPNSRNPSPYEDSSEATDANMAEQTPLANATVAVNSASQATVVPIVQGSPISCSSSIDASNAELTFNWDQFEVDLIADQLKQSALKFMVQPGGKPDDLTICVSKLKREVRTQ